MHAARAQVLQAHGRIGLEATDEDVQVRQLLAVGAFFEVVRVALEDQPIVGNPLLELEGSGPDRVRARPRAALVERGFRCHLDLNPIGPGECRDETGARVLELEAQRRLVGRLDGIDDLQLRSTRRLRVVACAEKIPRGDRGVERAAVVKDHALFELEVERRGSGLLPRLGQVAHHLVLTRLRVDELEPVPGRCRCAS